MQRSGCLRLSPSSSFPRWVTFRHSCSKLFVGGLSYDTNENVLKDAFGKHGEIIQVEVICDHVTGKSKGYGFVQFNSETAAAKALTQMDGQEKYMHTTCTQGVKARIYKMREELKTYWIHLLDQTN